MWQKQLRAEIFFHSPLFALHQEFFHLGQFFFGGEKLDLSDGHRDINGNRHRGKHIVDLTEVHAPQPDHVTGLYLAQILAEFLLVAVSQQLGAAFAAGADDQDVFRCPLFGLLPFQCQRKADGDITDLVLLDGVRTDVSQHAARLRGHLVGQRILPLDILQDRVLHPHPTLDPR